MVPSRPLPDSLTRLLKAPAEHVVAPTPGDRRRGEAPAAPLARTDSQLGSVVLRGAVLLLAGSVWTTIGWLMFRHLFR